MTYNPNIPQGDNWRPPSFVQIQQNFDALNTVFSGNHGAFDDATSSHRGKHTVVQLVPQTTTPTTEDQMGAVYIEDVTGIEEDILWYRPNLNATPIPLLIDGDHTIGGIPGSAAAYLQVTGVSTPFSIAILSSYNIASASISGNGAYVTLTFEKEMTNANYYPFTGVVGATTASRNVLSISDQNTKTVTFRRGSTAGQLLSVLIYGPILDI